MMWLFGLSLFLLMMAVGLACLAFAWYILHEDYSGPGPFEWGLAVFLVLLGACTIIGTVGVATGQISLDDQPPPDGCYQIVSTSRTGLLPVGKVIVPYTYSDRDYYRIPCP